MATNVKQAAAAKLSPLFKEGMSYVAKYSLLQDPLAYASAFARVPADNTIKDYGVVAFEFLTGVADHPIRDEYSSVDDALENLHVLAKRNKPALVRLLGGQYMLTHEKSTHTSSAMSPILRMATAKNPDILTVTDGEERLVVKQYQLSSILSEYDIDRKTSGRSHVTSTTDDSGYNGDYSGNASASSDAQSMYTQSASHLVELATDIVVSNALGSLVTDYAHCATPHFAYVFDWFVGPTLERTPGGVLEFDDAAVDQYIVVERADESLYALFARPQTTWRTVGAALFQVFFSLEAAWRLLGYTHNDLHTSNIMVRTLTPDRPSVFYNNVWRYKRAGERYHYFLAPQDHENRFVEIIDNGRARIFSKTREGNRVVVGNPEYTSIGDAEAALDRTLDLRTLAMHMLVFFDAKARRQGSTKEQDLLLDMLARAADIHTYAGAIRGALTAQTKLLDANDKKLYYMCATIRPKKNEALADQFRRLNAGIRAYTHNGKNTRALAIVRDGAFYSPAASAAFEESVNRFTLEDALSHTCFKEFLVPSYFTGSIENSILAGLVDPDDMLIDPERSPETRRDQAADVPSVAPTKCQFCGDASRGIAVGQTHGAHFCGADCMQSAHYGF